MMIMTIFEWKGVIRLTFDIDIRFLKVKKGKWSEFCHESIFEGYIAHLLIQNVLNLTTRSRRRRRRTTRTGRRRRTTTTRRTTTLRRRRRRPEGQKGGPKGPKEARRAKGGLKGLRQEVGARRAPELLVVKNVNILNFLKIVNTVSETPGFLRSQNILRSKNFLRCQHCQGAVKRHNAKRQNFKKE